ncbi:MAG: efflux RND transporter periplasmic adaptor subunit [Alphaproteobacteria bacterium]|jgi:cobalt-zinc-cadmium efflux system membrane fusion protein
MFSKILTYSIFLICLIVNPPLVTAHTGEPHASEPKNRAPEKLNELHLQKTGEIFEVVVAMASNKTPNTTIYLSDPDSNRPISEAEITLSLNSTNIKAEKTHKKGIYQAEIPFDSEQSLNIDIQKENLKEKFTFENISLPPSPYSFWSWIFKVSAVLLVLSSVAFVARKEIISRLKVLFSVSVLLLFSMSHAIGHGDHPGHSSENEESQKHAPHEEDKDQHVIAASSGGIIVPKELQFHLGIVTEKASEKPLKGTIRLVGTVISDPTGYARLQATQTARVINHPDYPLPLPGQAVKAGQVILAVAPTLTTIESTDQKNALYKAESEITQRRKEVGRLEKLGQYAAKKDLENAQAELERALKQKDEITNGTFKPELLRSPIDGFISDLHVRPGEIVTSDKTIAEVVDPNKLLVEALVFDPDIANQIVGGYIFSPLKPLKTINVKILGISPKVDREDQAIHIQLKPDKIDSNIKLDMTVEVVGELKETQPTLVIPQKAIAEDATGTWIFVHTNPETFEARKIRIRRQVADMVEIEEGLLPGERVVIEGAYLLNQAK